MYLLFDGVSQDGFIGLYDKNRLRIAEKKLAISWSESTKTISSLSDFLSENNLHYEDITHIVCVTGPGSFTGIRTVTLVVNTLAYIYGNIYLTALNFFDLYRNYPIVKQSSKRDLFVKYNESDIIQIVSNDDFIESCSQKHIYGDVSHESIRESYRVHKYIDYDMCMQDIELQNNKTLAPLYIKKPNIS